MVILPLPIQIGLHEALLISGVSLLLAYGPQYFPEMASKLGWFYGKKKDSY